MTKADQNWLENVSVILINFRQMKSTDRRIRSDANKNQKKAGEPEKEMTVKREENGVSYEIKESKPGVKDVKASRESCWISERKGTTSKREETK